MYVGVPVFNLPTAKALTLSGYAADVARGARLRGRNLAIANEAFQVALNSGPIDASKVALHRDLATTLYKVTPGLSGMGDDIDEITELLESGYFDDSNTVEPPSASGGDSWWESVLKTFAGQVGVGVAGRIAGQNPWAKPPIITVPPMSATTKALLIGGGVLAGGYVLYRAVGKR